jgi:4'-phosphopantetheinyl transferase
MVARNYSKNLTLKEIDLWLIDTHEADWNKALGLQYLLSDIEIKKFNNLIFHKDKRSYLISHISLRMILSFYCKISPLLIKYSFNKYNKPYIDGHQELYFNLSHTKDKAIIAISSQEVGVDIEHIINDQTYLEIANYYFEPEELNIINAQTNTKSKIRIFYQIWTMKEALMKGIGVGLIDKLPKLTFYKYNNKCVVTTNNRTWIVQTIQTFWVDYVASIAYLEQTPTINYYNYFL